MDAVVLNINGEDYQLFASPQTTLLHVLRDTLGLTGTKCGCDSASCGACKIIVDGEAVNACTVTVKKALGKPIETIEGMANANGSLHPIQQAFINCGAVQCGFCTPGMVLSAKALLAKNPNPTREEVKIAIDKNLCRCTGYVKIVDAIMNAAQLMAKTQKEAAK